MSSPSLYNEPHKGGVSVLTKEDLQALADLIDQRLDVKLEPVKADIATMKSDLAEVKENLSEVREASNYIAEWVEHLEKKVDHAI